MWIVTYKEAILHPEEFNSRVNYLQSTLRSSLLEQPAVDNDTVSDTLAVAFNFSVTHSLVYCLAVCGVHTLPTLYSPHQRYQRAKRRERWHNQTAS
jgi:hypothetical protein